MRLDGELLGFGPEYARGLLPSDTPETVRLRARLLTGLVPAGFVIAGRTAAWLYDGLAPGRYVELLAIARRGRPAGREELRIRYRDLQRAHYQYVDRIAVTTPARTLLDLADDPGCSTTRLRCFARAMALQPPSSFTSRRQLTSRCARRS